MKIKLYQLCSISLILISSVCYGSPISDSFNNGDTLTATQMNNIKSAVNDNDTRINQALVFPASIGYQTVPTANGITLTNTTLNGGTIIAPVAAGSTVDVSVDYSIIDVGCPGCVDQIVVGFSHSTTTIGCIYNGIPGGTTPATGTGTFTVTAPSQPGIYYLAFRLTQQYTCATSWAPPTTFDRFFAAISVQ